MTALSSVLIIAYRIKTILDRTVTVVIENVNGSLLDFDRPQILLQETNSAFYKLSHDAMLVSLTQV